MITVAMVLILVGTGCFLFRAVLGPSLADRVVAADGIIVSVVALVLLESIRQGTRLFLDMAVVVAVIGFVGTAAAARFIERKGA